jgi:hypothetical protein
MISKSSGSFLILLVPCLHLFLVCHGNNPAHVSVRFLVWVQHLLVRCDRIHARLLSLGQFPVAPVRLVARRRSVPLARLNLASMLRKTMRITMISLESLVELVSSFGFVYSCSRTLPLQLWNNQCKPCNSTRGCRTSHGYGLLFILMYHGD